MNNKLITGFLIVLFVAVAFLGVKAFFPSVTGGTETNNGSTYLTPQTYWGDTYALAYGTSPFSSPTQTLIDFGGAYVGIEGGATSTITTTSSLAASTLCAQSYFNVQNTTGSITLSIPAATSTNVASCLSEDGARTQFYILQNSTNTIVIASSTGDNMYKMFTSATSTGSYTLASATPVMANITVERVNSSTNDVFVTTFQ